MEIWKDINGYEGAYKVSNTGKVWSVRSNREIVAVASGKGGYYKLGLYKNGKRINCLLHRLVAEAFCQKKEGCEEVNHIIPLSNGGSNHADNLEWVTHKDNCIHSGNIGNLKGGIGLAKPVQQLDLIGNFLQQFESASKAHQETGVAISGITRVANGQRKTAGGYKWKYVEA